MLRRLPRPPLAASRRRLERDPQRILVGYGGALRVAQSALADAAGVDAAGLDRFERALQLGNARVASEDRLLQAGIRNRVRQQQQPQRGRALQLRLVELHAGELLTVRGDRVAA